MSLETPDGFSVGTADGLLRTHAAVVAAYRAVVELMGEAKLTLTLSPLAKLGFSAKPLDPQESLQLADRMSAACCGADVAESVFGLEAQRHFGDAYLALSKDLGNLPPLVFAAKVSGDSLQITPSYHAQLLLFATFKTMVLRDIFEGVIEVPKNFLNGMERARRHFAIEDFHTNRHELSSDTLAMAMLEFRKAQEILRERSNGHSNESIDGGDSRDQDSMPKLPISVNGNTICLNGVEWPVEPHHAAWVRMLIEAHSAGRKITNEEFESIAGCHGKNISREWKKLFDQIDGLKEIIATKESRGGGRWLKI